MEHRVERVPHLLSRLVDAPRDGAFGGLEDDRCFWVTQPLHHRQCDGGFEQRGEAIEGAHEIGISLTKLEGAVRVPARIDRDRDRDARIVEVFGAPAGPIAPHVEGAIQCNAIEPGEELTPSFEAVDIAICTDERVLCDVVRIAWASGHVEREREDSMAVAFDQRLEGAWVAAARSFHQIVRLTGSFFFCWRGRISLLRMWRRASRYMHFCL